MATERRNLYRILHVQPEAPAAVIKASYRALMTTLGAHPDRGGQHEIAAQLNVAYAVLGDAVRRASYDAKLERPARRAHAGQGAGLFDASDWQREGRCPFCTQRFEGTPRSDSRCGRCGAPLSVAPGHAHSNPELVGRRQGERYVRPLAAQLRLPGLQARLPVRLRDLSLQGLSMACPQRLQPGTVFRVEARGVDAVGQVMACRVLAPGYSVHARLMTLAVEATTAGTFVEAVA